MCRYIKYSSNIRYCGESYTYMCVMDIRTYNGSIKWFIRSLNVFTYSNMMVIYVNIACINVLTVERLYVCMYKIFYMCVCMSYMCVYMYAMFPRSYIGI